MIVIDLSDSVDPYINLTAKHLKENPGYCDRVLRLIRHADLGISDLKVSDEQVKFFSLLSSGNTLYPSGTTLYPSNIPAHIVATGDSASFTVPAVSGHVSTTPAVFGQFPSLYTISSIHRSTDGTSVPFNFFEAE